MNIHILMILPFFLFGFIGAKSVSDDKEDFTITCIIKRESNQPVIVTIEVPPSGETILHSSVMSSHDITSDCADECELHDPDCDPDLDFEALLNDGNIKQKKLIDSPIVSTQVTNIHETPQHIVLTLATGEQNFSGSSIIESGNGEISVIVAKE